MSRENTESSRFAERLRKLMRERGFVSATSRSGIDVGALAQAAGTSYEMARRYAEGLAMPRPEKLAAVASWLRVPASALAFAGDSKGGAGLDMELLQQCIAAVASAQERTGQRISTEKAAHLVALLYQEAIEGEIPAASSVDLLVKAAT